MSHACHAFGPPQITAQIKAEEADLAARIAYETRAELEREEAERTQAKTSLVQFLAGNEVCNLILF